MHDEPRKEVPVLTPMSTLSWVLISGASLVIIVAGMRAAASLLGFVLFAGLLATCLAPLVEWIGRRGVSRALALLTTILGVMIGGLVLATVLGASAVRLFQTLPTYEARLAEVQASLQQLQARLGMDVAQFLSREMLNPQRVITLARGLLGGILHAMSTSLFFFLLVALMLVAMTAAEARFRASETAGGGITARLFEVRTDVRKFVSITALGGLVTAVANVILLVVLGVDFPVLWGVLSFLFGFIPAIGGLLSLVPPALLAWLALGWTRALIVIVGFALINNITDIVLKPRLMQKGLDISILLIFLSLMFWSWVLGPIGAILAVPLTIVVKRLVVELAEADRSASSFNC
jgi:predicted PurR-regulated permease PerM